MNLAENRRAADFPSAPRSALDWAAWPRAFEAWHDDHFGLRVPMLRAHNALMIFGLHTSPSPRLAIGKDHWVFRTAVDLDVWRGSNPFSEAELEAWRRCLESRRHELEQRGIKFYFVLAPSKAAIYPEFLPAQYRSGGPSRTDQLVQHLAEHSSFRILDLRAALLEEKRADAGDDYTYFPLGTHWNERGALAGVRAIVAELGDNWAKRLYLEDSLTQTVRSLTLSEPALEAMTITKLEDKRTIVVEGADAALPRAIVLHDSFGEPLAGVLGRHFSRSVWVWETAMDVELLEREKPDFLIQLFNDRVLATLQPQEFNAGDVARVRAQFEASREVALLFDPATNSPKIQHFQDASVALRIEAERTRVACKLDTPAGAFLLPEFALRRGAHAIVRLEFESPIAGTAVVLFQIASDRTYRRGRQLPFDIQQGFNTLYVEILAPDLADKLLFRPASEPGTFLVSALEVRLVPD